MIKQMELEIYNQRVEGIHEAVITTFEVALPYPITKKFATIGYDPGITKMAIAILRPDRDYAEIHKIEVSRIKDAVKRIVHIQKIVNHCLPPALVIYYSATIEGASYGAKYRQVELAEARAAVALLFYRFGIQTKIVPPNTIRKHAFGDGGEKNPWNNIDNDCAASLGCAYYGYK